MPDLSHVTTPVEWVVTHSAATWPIAVIRRLRLGPDRELYFRAVTWHQDASKRELVGYWGSVEEAVQNVYGLYERSLPPQFLMTGGGEARQPAALTKPKAPPSRVTAPAASARSPRQHPDVTHAARSGQRQPIRHAPPSTRQLSSVGR